MRKFLTNPIKFTVLTLVAALLAALLRSLALVLAFEGNYFTGSPLAITQTVVTVVFALALFILPLTVAKPSITRKERELSGASSSQHEQEFLSLIASAIILAPRKTRSTKAI